MDLSPRERAEKLLGEMTLDEKIYQVTAEMIFEVDENYEKKRDPLCGSYRNPGHFMHHTRKSPASPSEVCERINKDVEISIKAQAHGIPPIENGEALHGAQWGMATAFPQPIGMASSFDPELVAEVADVIGKECRAAGVRQVFSPVVNIVRDCRWGRTVETYGEDVTLTCDMGAAMCRGLEKNGVIATPKHFADNYAAGGRDSNYSDNSERTLREVFLPPFKACFDAGAQSVMAAYNSWDGIPCTANRRLLTDILRSEWGFDGFVVSDYGGVEGLESAHRFARSQPDAAAKALKAGLNVILPYASFDEVRQALDSGLMTESDLDRAVLPLLTAKFRLGLFDEPYQDPQKADETVRCKEHKELALRMARESIVLLKNNGVLPLDKNKIKKIGVFGESSAKIPVGENYSGPYAYPWTGEDAPTPLEALREYLGEDGRIVTSDIGEIGKTAAQCDVNIFFTSIIEGEGSDRSDLRLPSITSHKADESDGGVIVGAASHTVREDQIAAIKEMLAANENSVVVLLNGAPVEMTQWLDETGAVIEAWYPGEQGARALTEILFGETNPSGKLPICIPRSVGQLPLYYSYKPSGRGYGYCDNDGKPLYTFGYGLSYTEFEIKNARLNLSSDAAEIHFDIENKGKYDGEEVVQLYIGAYNCDVVRPVKELKAYKRIAVKAGGCVSEKLSLTADDLKYYDSNMVFSLHDGDCALMLGTSSDDIAARFDIEVRDGRLTQKQG